MNEYSPTMNDKSSLIPLSKRNVYNQSGLAAAIYLGNQKKQLPVVHFRLTVNPSGHSCQPFRQFIRFPDKFVVELEGGLLIQTLPSSFAESIKHLSSFEQIEYCRAFEADIINLLVGPLAEAKYVALQDNEPFNANLVYLHALHIYGGKANLKLVNDYMECFIPNNKEREQKLAELFLKAYDFINVRSNWKAIVSLAEFILKAFNIKHRMVIDCDQIIAFLEPECEPADGQYTPLLPEYLETLTLR